MGHFKRRIPLVILVSVWLTLTFAIAMMSGLAGVSAGNRLIHHNPFAAYGALWPGQSIESVAAYAWQTPQGFIPCLSSESAGLDYDGLTMRHIYSALDDTKSTVCTYSPDDNVFQGIMVTIVDNRVQELQFFSDVLLEDSLLLYWGMPDAVTRFGNDQALDLRWNRTTYQARAVAQPVRLGAIVKTVMLTARE